jgi:hypothetical protein
VHRYTFLFKSVWFENTNYDDECNTLDSFPLTLFPTFPTETGKMSSVCVLAMLLLFVVFLVQLLVVVIVPIILVVAAVVDLSTTLLQQKRVIRFFPSEKEIEMRAWTKLTQSEDIYSI